MNDDTGRLAYDPAVLLKIVLYGYYKGIVSSRRLLCLALILMGDGYDSAS